MEFTAPALRLNSIRILVVDDSKDICFLWRRILEKQGASVTAVGTVKEALAVVESYLPDVILSDLSMPDADGFAFLDKFKALDMHRRDGRPVPVLAISGHDDPMTRQRSLRAGFAGYVTKPVDSQELVLHVARLAAGDAKPC